MEGDFADCLGNGMEHGDDGAICMTWKGAVEKIIAMAKMKECNLNKTLAPTTALGSNAKGKPWDQNHWDCASIVGMLLCVSNNARADSTLAASQVA